MQAKDLEEAEKRTVQWHANRGALLPGGSLNVSHVRYIPPDRNNYYYGDTNTKKRIVLHFTIGFLGGDLSTLTRDNYHVSVPYLISRDGSVFEIHDPSMWSYHLGKHAVGGNEQGSREGIGIELTNIGPLDISGNWLWNTYGQKYCHIDENQYYTTLEQPYRGYSHYAKFTDDQYKELANLLVILSTTYDIPLEFLEETERFELFPSAQKAKHYRGICSHVNFRGFYEKTDIGPAFDWQRIISMTSGKVSTVIA